METKIYALLAVLTLILSSFPPFVQGENKENDRMYATVKIYTSGGIREINKKLTKEEVIKLMEMVNEADEPIDSLLQEMKRYGLLGDFSIEKIKKLISPEYQNPEIQKIELLSNIFQHSGWEVNIMCRMYASGMILDYFPWTTILDFLINFFYYHNYQIFSDILVLLWAFLDIIPHFTTVGYWKVFYEPFNPRVITVGLLGSKTMEGGEIGLITVGFTGVVINFGISSIALGFCPFIAMKKIIDDVNAV